MARELVLGTRGSALALAQSGQVGAAIEAAAGVSVRLEVIRTRGDAVQDRPLAEIGGKGLFTAELEEALRDGRIDLAVHSLKDLPTDDPPGLRLGCVPKRADPRDVLVGAPLDALARGARVGTGSLRRRLQLSVLRPDLVISDIRGNVDTRLRKRDGGDFDAIVLAAAGMVRLGIVRDDAFPLSVAQMVPAVGQGALAIQVRDGDTEVGDLVRTVHHEPTWNEVSCERAFLVRHGGGCNVPAACHAWWDGGVLRAAAVAEGADGVSRRVEAALGEGALTAEMEPEALGAALAAALGR